MFSLAILKADIRGMNYGLGTYITQLTLSLLKHSDIRIYLINYFSDKYKDLTIANCNNNRLINIHIPLPKLFKNSEKNIQKHSSRVIDILSVILKEEKKIVFQVNYPSILPLIKEIKRRFPHPVISVIHSAAWQFLTFGNKQELSRISGPDRTFLNSAVKELVEEKELYELADRIVSVTNYMKRFVCYYYGICDEKIDVVPNGLDISDLKLPTDQEKINIKKELGFNANEKIIVFSGRLDKEKGLHFLFLAFNKVFEKDTNVRLIIMGEDSGKTRINDFLSYCKNSWSKITFTGFLDHDDLDRFYMIANIGILPSIYDHCPYTALELMAYKIPIIMSNTEGLNEILSEKQAVYIEPLIDKDGNISFNVSDFAEVILSLLEEEGKNRKITKDYHKLLKSKFSSSLMGRNMYMIYKNCFKVVEGA